MVIINMPRPRHHERGLARQLERRSPQEGASASVSATPSQSGAPEATPTAGHQVYRLSTSLKSLAAVITVLGIVIWRVVAWRRRKQNAPSMRSNQKAFTPFPPSAEVKTRDLEANLQQPQKAVLFPAIPSRSAGVNWVPQVKPTIYVHYDAKGSDDSSDEELDEMPEKLKQYTQVLAPDREKEMTLPPSYNTAHGKKLSMSFTCTLPPPPPAPRTSKFSIATPPTPPASLKLKHASQNSFSIPPPEPSPRSSSFSHQVTMPKASKAKTSSNPFSKDHKLPRLMTVVTTFQPSMDDELSIETGETLRLLEEYEDEWCLVQRVGRYDAEKGVIPRFCLVERPVVVMPSPHKQAILAPTSFAS
ncbi:hypothetical protein NEOLEDRAFT_1146542 [Neolentinus lepideus HHB14362 ss-1]|uniref:SH3 domain-containing protein n=1 Tax=Neolentinus lepideus HHB14362 ss-1 TaxID=1314782 RepID=A0A165TXJ2_9AGAM|nr:hypothetical protein NEOLEDRAFT_1146542 [Neolentinus lepideus HHB14362 ss-1]